MNFARLNVWDPFGDDRPANQVAIDALQTAAELAAARRVYDLIPNGRLGAEHRQREHHGRLSSDLDAFADRAGQPRDLFREVLERKLRRDYGGKPDLSPLPGHAEHDDNRRALEREVLLAEQADANARRLVKRSDEELAAFIAAHHHDQRRLRARRADERLTAARSALAEYDLGRGVTA